MKGNMMNWDLTIPQAILHAEKYNVEIEITEIGTLSNTIKDEII